MSATPEKFVLDANVFIQAKRRFYAFDFCPGYWDMLLAPTAWASLQYRQGAERDTSWWR